MKNTEIFNFSEMSKKILVTGSAGFIGFHLCELISKENYIVIGIDSFNKLL